MAVGGSDHQTERFGFCKPRILALQAVNCYSLTIRSSSPLSSQTVTERQTLKTPVSTPTYMNPCSWRVAAAPLQTAGKTKQLPQQQWVFVKHTQPNKRTEHMQHIFCIGEGALVCAAVELMRHTNCRT